MPNTEEEMRHRELRLDLQLPKTYPAVVPAYMSHRVCPP